MFNVHFTVSKMTTKFLWGRLEGVAPHNFLVVGRSPPSPTLSRRLRYMHFLSFFGSYHWSI